MIKDTSIILNFCKSDSVASAIKDKLVNLTLAACSRNYGKTGMVGKFEVENYMKENAEAKTALLTFAAENSHISELKTKSDMAMAFSNNAQFSMIFNSIIADVLRGVNVNVISPQLLALANISTVGVGDSETWEIETKGLPVAQRTTHMNNVALLNGLSMSSITITPKMYSLGTTIDYIRILNADYDLGAELARVTLGMLYAQYKLVASLIYSTSTVPTALYKSTFTSANYVQLKQNLETLNGAKGVTAYGTGVAFNAIGALASTNGFATKDEYIRNGYIGKIFGVDGVMVDQGTDFSAPITDQTSLDNMSLISDSYIIMISNVGDKPCKLVKEDYIRVKQEDNMAGSLNRIEYKYFQAFDAAIATQAHYGIQNVSAT